MEDQQVYSLWRNNEIFAGFWIRFAAMFIDGLVIAPFSILFMYFSSFNRLNNIYIYVLQFFVLIFYHVYLVKSYGGTLGKLAVGIRIINMNGDKVGWEESIYRYIVSIVLSIITFMITVFSVLTISDEQYMSVGVFHRSTELLKGNSVYNYYMLLSAIWFLCDLIVMLASDKNRSIHDLIGNTVVVKDIYLNDIKEYQRTTVSE